MDSVLTRNGQPRHAKVETATLVFGGSASVTHPALSYFALSINVPTGASADITEQADAGPIVTTYAGPVIVNYADPQRIDFDTEITITALAGTVYVQHIFQ